MPTHDQLAHDALVYDTDDRFVEVLAPFVANGLKAGEHAYVVTRLANADLLRDALGADAHQVQFVDAVDWYRHPARTIAGYHRTIRSARAAGARRIRVVGEVEFGETKAEHAAWIRYESIINAVFAPEPAWVICPYDARRLPAGIVESARITHDHETVGPEEREHSDWYISPDRFVSALPIEMRGEVLADIELHTDLRPVRALAGRLARRIGLSRTRTVDLTLLMNELASNAVVHGQPPAHLWACHDDGALIVEVRDAGGTPFDPVAGFHPPGRGGTGVGLWLCRQLADRLEITTDPLGTTARARMTVAGR